MQAAQARDLWLVGEPIHALTYFAQPSFDAWAAAGIRGFWRGYFATRAAPFGAVGPEVVTASFSNFDPAMVAQALPGVWEMASPAAALEARLTGVDGSLRAVVGAALGDDALTAPVIGETVSTLHEVVDAAGGITAEGRALHQHVESVTDALAAAPWQAVGDDRAERVRAALLPWAPTVSR